MIALPLIMHVSGVADEQIDELERLSREYHRKFDVDIEGLERLIKKCNAMKDALHRRHKITSIAFSNHF